MKHIKDKYKGMSFSDAASKIAKKYKNKAFDPIERQSYEAELKELMRLQTAKRIVQQGKEVNKLRFGGGIEPPIVDPGLAVPANMRGKGIDLQGINIDRVLGSATSQPMDKLPMANTPRVTAPRDLGMKGGITSPNDSTGKPFKLNLSQLGEGTNPAMIGHGINLLTNAGILAGGADVEDPDYNPYEQEVRNELGSLSINREAIRNKILGRENAAREGLRNVRSTSVRQALEANLAANTQNSMADVSLNEQNANNQYRAAYANALNMLGQQRASTDQMTDELNARNKGVYRSELSKFGNSMADLGEYISTRNLNKNQNRLVMNILDNKYESVGLNKDTLEKYMSGKDISDDEIVKLKDYLGKDVLQELNIDSWQKYYKDNK